MVFIPAGVIVFVFLLTCLEIRSQIAVVDLQPRNLLQMQLGIGWPHVLHVVEGHEALLRVEGRLENQESCRVTTPAGVEFDVNSPPSNRYEPWSDSCGVRVRSVGASDAGRWRLNATGGNHTLAGWTAVFVDNDTTSYTGPEIDILDGQTNTQVELTTLENSYCLVTQPFSESSLVPGHCRVTLNRTTRAVQGNWDVLLGLPGKIQELPFQRRVAVEAERLDTGYVRDTANNKLHLYCNILNTSKNITFCRFQRTTSSVGFNVIDGLSDGSHSYYGEGFMKRHCGMTIEQPSTQDYGTWRCSVGVQQWVDSNLVQQTPLQALISVGPDYTRVRSTANKVDEEVQTVFVQAEQSFTVMCRADESLAYCWFQHPNGTQFTPVPIESENQPYWYTGENLQVGDCGITFAHATEEESGDWTCHMGPGSQLGLEITDRIHVRVTGPLAANVNEISTFVGSSVTLYCHTSNGNKPLEYCRFLTPTALGFRIDSTVTEDRAILGRYFFSPGRDLDYGDCSLTISILQEEDLGRWTCAALINDEVEEARDTITIYIDAARTPLTRAGVVGMSVGLSVLVIALFGALVYKRRWHLKLPYCRNELPTSQGEMLSMNSVSPRESNKSKNSDLSNNSSEVDVMSRQVTELGTTSQMDLKRI